MNTLRRHGRDAPHPSRVRVDEHLVLGRFRMIEPLGSGGHGTVWAARDERLRRTVAVKQIPRAPSGEAEDGRRIGREVLAAARVAHPAIVTFHEALCDDHAYYLVSELVEGSSLATLYAGAGLDDRELMRIGIAIADALAHAHARGVVHRDVKPHNIIVADDTQQTGAPAKLTDFGVAHIADEAPLTQSGDVIGTFAYMAPEQAEGRGASPASDLFALALTLYEGFTGTNPLRGVSAADTVRRLGYGVRPLRQLRGDLPASLCSGIDRALSIDPLRRGAMADLRGCLAVALGARGQRRRGGASAAHHRALTPRGERLTGAAAAAATTACGLATVFGPWGATSIACAAALSLVLVALMPRAGWLTLAFAGIAALALSGQPGSAVLLCVALAPAPLLLASDPWLWSVPLLAPLLGAVGVAGAFPALAGRLGGARAWRRAALGALGYWWVAIVAALAGTRFLFGLTAAARPRGSWQASVPGVFTHVIVPLCSPARLAPAALWAIAALVLPWLLRGESLASRAAAALVWAAALTLASVVLARSLGGFTTPLAVVAALLAGVAAASLGERRFRVPARARLA